MDAIVLPVKIHDVHGGFAHVDGILTFAHDKLQVQFQTTTLGFIKSGVKNITIPMDELVDVELKKIFLSANRQLRIQTNNLSRSEKIPNQQSGIIKFNIHKDFVNKAQQLERACRMALGLTVTDDEEWPAEQAGDWDQGR